MTEYIDKTTARRAALAPCSKCWIENGKAPVCDGCELYGVAQAIDRIPAADVRPVVRATWRRYSPFTDTYECSNCGEQVIDQQFRTNFCPNCGAKMEEGE